MFTTIVSLLLTTLSFVFNRCCWCGCCCCCNSRSGFQLIQLLMAIIILGGHISEVKWITCSDSEDFIRDEWKRPKMRRVSSAFLLMDCHFRFGFSHSTPFNAIKSVMLSILIPRHFSSLSLCVFFLSFLDYVLFLLCVIYLIHFAEIEITLLGLSIFVLSLSIHSIECWIRDFGIEHDFFGWISKDALPTIRIMKIGLLHIMTHASAHEPHFQH